jgi:YfiH family protein
VTAAPQLPEPFALAGEHVAIDLPGAHVLFTTRRGGVSTGPYRSLNLGLWTDDDPAAVRENRDRVGGLCDIPAERFAYGRQVHGARVRRRTAVPEPGAEPVEEDGQAISVPGVAAFVLVADCLPVAIAGDGAVAMLHCGWRSLAGGIIGEGVRALRELGAGGPLSAAIGPGAGVCCYETGDEVREAFAAHGEEVRRGRNVDLPLVARRELEAAGVDTVHDVGLCTICSDPELFFSHRRDGGVTGRQGGLAWLS